MTRPLAVLSLVILLLLSAGVFWACQVSIAPPSAELSSESESQPTAARLPREPVPALSFPPCHDPPLSYITDLQVRQTPVLSEPEPRVPFRDPVFGTCLVRLTDRANDLSPDDPSAGLKNEYSRVQSFNADGSRLLLRQNI